MAVLPFAALPKVLSIMGNTTIPKNMKKVMGTAAREFGRSVVTNTPVDEGDARAGWVASVGAPSPNRRFAFNPNQALGSAKKTLGAGRFADIPNAAGAIAQHNTELVKFKNAPAGVSFFFSNNHPYIVPLEQGKLRGGQTLQNTAGWVERSINLAAQRALLINVIPKQAGGGRQFTSFNVRRRP